MKIYLIRHGETTGDIEGRFGGDYDDHLTDRGKEQAIALADFLADKGLELLLHSPRIRAVETAAIVHAQTGVPVETLEVLRERNNYGVLSGLTKKEAAAQHPAELAKIEQDKIYHTVLYSESYEDTKVRALGAWAEITTRPENVLGVVSHGGIIGTILREKFGHQTAKIGDCSVIEIESTDAQCQITRLRDVTLA